MPRCRMSCSPCAPRTATAARWRRWSSGTSRACGGWPDTCSTTRRTPRTPPRRRSQRCCTRIDQFRGEARFATWLYSLVTNTCRDLGERQRRRRHQPLETAPEVASATGPARSRRVPARAARRAGAGAGGPVRRPAPRDGDEGRARALLRGDRGASWRCRWARSSATPTAAGPACAGRWSRRPRRSRRDARASPCRSTAPASRRSSPTASRSCWSTRSPSWCRACAPRGRYHVRDDAWYLRGHFPGRPIMPGVLQVEALAQVGAVCGLVIPGFAGRLALFAGIDDVRFKRIVVPGRHARPALPDHAPARADRQGRRHRVGGRRAGLPRGAHVRA